MLAYHSQVFLLRREAVSGCTDLNFEILCQMINPRLQRRAKTKSSGKRIAEKFRRFPASSVCRLFGQSCNRSPF